MAQPTPVETNALLRTPVEISGLYVAVLQNAALSSEDVSVTVEGLVNAVDWVLGKSEVSPASRRRSPAAGLRGRAEVQGEYLSALRARGDAPDRASFAYLASVVDLLAWVIDPAPERPPWWLTLLDQPPGPTPGPPAVTAGRAASR